MPTPTPRRLPRALAAIALLLAGVLPLAKTGAAPAPAARASDESEIERYKKYLKSPDAGTRADAASSLGAVDTPASVDVLLGALKDKAEEVRDAAVQALSSMKSDESVARLVAALQSAPDPGVRASIGVALGRSAKIEALAALVQLGSGKTMEERRAAAEALGSYKVPDASETLVKLASDPDTTVRITAVRSLGRSAQPAGIVPVAAAVADPTWQVRAAAYEAAARIRHKDLVGPIVKQMEAEDGRLKGDARDALEKMTGMNFGLDAKEWAEWWARSGATFELPKPSAKGGGAAAAVKAAGTGNEKKYAGPAVRYYGIDTPSKHVLFLLDVSKSMSERTLLPGTDEESGKPNTTPRTSAGGSAVPTLSGKTGRVYTSPIKIEIAKEELVYTIQELDENTYFDIVTFETEVERWKGDLVPATAGNREAAISFVKKQKPRGAEPVRSRGPRKASVSDEGRTNVWGALKAAFGAQSNQPVDKYYYKSRLDTIFMLSDGLPTEGELTSTDDILTEVRKINGLRSVVIHTIQMGKITQGEFLKLLAEENGGKWVNLTP